MQRRRLHNVFALLVCLLVVDPLSASAATNSALGGIGGVNNGTLSGGDGTGTAQVILNAVDLALVKQVRDLTGRVLPDGADVAAGQEIYFVLYVDNPTSYPVEDLQVTDLLDESQFTYIPNTLEELTVSSGADDATIWAGTWSGLTDDPGSPDDVASIIDTGAGPGRDRLTIGAVTGQTNASHRVPGSSLRAIRFRVRVN